MSSSRTFQLTEMRSAAIRRRTLQPHSVHYSTENGRWIATLTFQGNRYVAPDSKHLTFNFSTEHEATRFAQAYAPPIITKIPPDEAEASCFMCNEFFPRKKGPVSAFHYFSCCNCGVAVCHSCSSTWSSNMIPKTYTLGSPPCAVRVCRSCDWLSNAFCIALLKGRLEDVKALYTTGNVNLRCAFADIKSEAMLPVHCAILGGNLDVLRWLIDTQECPITKIQPALVKRRMLQRHKVPRMSVHSIRTSKKRTMIDLALTGKKKMEILRYLVAEKNISVSDTKNPRLTLQALDDYFRRSILEENDIKETKEEDHAPTTIQLAAYNNLIDTPSMVSLEDPCVICYERSLADSVLIPCGHQVCCMECGLQLTECPICKESCSAMKVFRQ